MFVAWSTERCDEDYRVGGLVDVEAGGVGTSVGEGGTRLEHMSVGFGKNCSASCVVSK